MHSEARSIASPNGETKSFLTGLWCLSFHVISDLAVCFHIGLGVRQQTAPDDAATAVSTMDNEFHRIGVKVCYHLMPIPLLHGCKVELIIRAVSMYDMRNPVPRLRVVFQPIFSVTRLVFIVTRIVLISEMLQRMIVGFLGIAHFNTFEMLQAQ